MPTNEDLYHEMEREEEETDARFGIKSRIITKQPRQLPNAHKAQERFDRELSVRLERSKRVAAGLPPTNNPVKNIYLRLTGQHITTPREGFSEVEPSKEFKPIK